MDVRSIVRSFQKRDFLRTFGALSGINMFWVRSQVFPNQNYARLLCSVRIDIAKVTNKKVVTVSSASSRQNSTMFLYMFLPMFLYMFKTCVLKYWLQAFDYLAFRYQIKPKPQSKLIIFSRFVPNTEQVFQSLFPLSQSKGFPLYARS